MARHKTGTASRDAELARAPQNGAERQDLRDIRGLPQSGHWNYVAGSRLPLEAARLFLGWLVGPKLAESILSIARLRIRFQGILKSSYSLVVLVRFRIHGSQKHPRFIILLVRAGVLLKRADCL